MKRSFVPATVAAVSAALVLGLGSSAAEATKAVATKPSTQKVIMFSSDGMRPDLMQRYAAAGAMPTYQALMNAGVIGDNGMKQAFPPNTGVGRARLDEQHLPPHGRGQLQQLDERAHDGHPAGRLDHAGSRASRQDRRLR